MYVQKCWFFVTYFEFSRKIIRFCVKKHIGSSKTHMNLYNYPFISLYMALYKNCPLQLDFCESLYLFEKKQNLTFNFFKKVETRKILS
jgi:hypothetical protein